MICLYFGIEDECLNCGGWTKVDGEASHALDGNDYCSEDCAEEAAGFASRAMTDTGWCSTCGYDRHEHADDCERST